MSPLVVAVASVVAIEWIALGVLTVRGWLLDRKLRRLCRECDALRVVKAMLEGHRPIVTVPPRGETLLQAQQEVDALAAMLAPKSKRPQA